MRVAVLSFAHERAETYARLLHARPDVELLIADPEGSPENQEKARAVAAELGVSYVDEWDDVLEWLPIAVVVTTEVERRPEIVERLAEAEAFVLCEQPLALKEAAVKEMVDNCDMGGVRLTLASPACYGGAFDTVRKGIADGIVGTLTTIHGSYNTRPTDGGALAANAPVLLDVVDTVLGGEPARQVYAQTNSILSGRSDVESAAVVTVTYANGVVASFDCSWSQEPTAGPVVSFVGDKATVEYTASPRMLGGVDTAGHRRELGGGDQISAMLTDFLGTVETRAGSGPDGQAALRTQRVIQAAYESAQTGQPVDLK
ncbi:Gfo/Idh/MocA family protein [Kutzneria kofuensis]|uniref:Putative dehydrogenase n=1 Tax=Kutzneria kofuensis TaxID=103725 RepID=A0A7W9NIN1_9PSEU|nr:Gfo/Idh/MocA family oxidoreductase [Kutzneria kofuensis]MBB5893754.1 putative dehydrogenase [Kutzneria kofuensis]